MGPISSILRPCPVHLFFDAAVLQEALLDPLDEALEEDVLLMDEGDGDVGDSLVAAEADLLAIDGRVEMRAAEGTRLAAPRIVERPLLQVAHAQIVLIVEKQFLQAGAVDIDEFNHHLRGGHSVNISLGKVLLSRPRRLNHLVYRPVAGREKLMSEIIGDIVDALSLLEGFQRVVVVMLV